MICPHCGRCSCCGHRAWQRWPYGSEPYDWRKMGPLPLIPSPPMYGNVNDALRRARAAVRA